MTETSADREALYTKARAEIALLALLGGLLVPTFLSLFLAETGLGARKVALGVVGASFLGPALLLKGPLAARSVLGIPLTAACTGAAALVTTGNALLAGLCAAVGALAALAFYRIRSNMNYRPRLRGE